MRESHIRQADLVLIATEATRVPLSDSCARFGRYVECLAELDLPALLSLALVALTACTLIAYEVYRYAEARDRIRHGL